jgi:hypothetical protein
MVEQTADVQKVKPTHPNANTKKINNGKNKTR